MYTLRSVVYFDRALSLSECMQIKKRLQTACDWSSNLPPASHFLFFSLFSSFPLLLFFPSFKHSWKTSTSERARASERAAAPRPRVPSTALRACVPHTTRRAGPSTGSAVLNTPYSNMIMYISQTNVAESLRTTNDLFLEPTADPDTKRSHAKENLRSHVACLTRTAQPMAYPGMEPAQARVC